MAYNKIRKDGTPSKKPGKAPDGSKPLQNSYFSKGVQRPHVWKAGPDPIRHDKYTAWLKAKAQANFRGEPWKLTFEDFEQLWGDHWFNRGRKSTDSCMTRVNVKGAWDPTNTIIIIRKEHLANQGIIRKAKGMKYNKHK